VGIAVLICEAPGLARTGLRKTLEQQADMQVVDEVADGRAALDVARRLRPDVALLDDVNPPLDAVEVTRRIAVGGDGGTRVVLLRDELDENRLIEAVRAGAWGYLGTDSSPEEVVQTVRTVAAGGAVFAPAAARIVLDHVARTPTAQQAVEPEGLSSLSSREFEVLSLLSHGLSNTEIADSLGRSEATVKSHISSLLTKLQLRDRLQAVVFAYQNGLVTEAPQGLPAERP
jgi:DNA-binding NarL/FixJ family response regulator